MARGSPKLQDAYLNQLRREATPVTIYLVNGVQVRGIVRGFDNFTVVVEHEGRQLLIYKHALSTLAPAAPFTLARDSRRVGDEAAATGARPVPETQGGAQAGGLEGAESSPPASSR